MAEAEANGGGTILEQSLGETIPPYAMSADLRSRVEALGLLGHVEDLRDRGYTIIRDIADPAFNALLRETVLRHAVPRENNLVANKEGASMLLGRDAVFEEALLNPRILTLAEVAVGKGFQLYVYTCSLRRKDGPTIGIHVDQVFIPAPFPDHTQLITFCWATDDFSVEAGCTAVIPGSQSYRRHPNRAEAAAVQDEAIPASAPANSVIVWRGDVWHTNLPRTIGGERAVVHMSFSRMTLRPLENYQHLDDDWLEGRPEELQVLLGRRDVLQKNGIGAEGGEAFARTFAWARQ